MNMSSWILLEQRAKVLTLQEDCCLVASLSVCQTASAANKQKKGKREARTRKKPNLTTLRVIREVICSICGFNEGKSRMGKV